MLFCERHSTHFVSACTAYSSTAGCAVITAASISAVPTRRKLRAEIIEVVTLSDGYRAHVATIPTSEASSHAENKYEFCSSRRLTHAPQCKQGRGVENAITRCTFEKVSRICILPAAPSGADASTVEGTRE